MIRYSIIRLLQTILLLFFLSILIFTLLNLMPGDEKTLYLIENPGSNPTKYEVEQFIKHKGYDKPYYIQYINTMAKILRGNFGYSERYQIEIVSLLPHRISVTLKLSIPVLFFSLFLAIPIGIFSSIYQYSGFDYAIQFIIFLGISLPTFWVGLSCIYLFSLELGLFPASGVSSIGVSNFFDSARHYTLPIFVLCFHSIGTWVRYLRGNFLEVIKMDYMKLARAKGLAADKIILKHAFKNVFISLLTLIGLSIPHLISGALVTEQIFGIPGMGQLLINSVMDKDRNMALIAFLLLALLTLVFNLLVDILYYIVDPRIKRRD